MGNGYKKYMKKDVKRNNPLLQVFIISFFSMLLIFTFLIKSFSPTVDTSIGDYQDQSAEFDQDDVKKVDNNRLEMIQQEDQGRSFTELISKPEDIQRESNSINTISEQNSIKTEEEKTSGKNTKEVKQEAEPIYKVFVGTYTSAEQAKVAKDIIQESGNGLNPIVKCIGSNNYTLQVGIFKNKQSAESLLYTVQQNHLPGRIVQDY